MNIMELFKPVQDEELTELAKTMMEYDKIFPNVGWDTESYFFTDEELLKIFKECIEKGKDFFEVTGIERSYNRNDDEDD